jgi:hypothetical protein
LQYSQARIGLPKPSYNLKYKTFTNGTKDKRKGRNPRITVCYTPDENEKIVGLASSLWAEEKPVYP